MGSYLCNPCNGKMGTSHCFLKKWKWRDIRPSMVTHTRNLCSAINPSKVHTHSSEHTHTVNTHPEQWAAILCCGARGAVGGSVPCSRATSVVVLRVERVLYIHSPHLQFLPARDSNSQPLGYESDSLTIGPWLPHNTYVSIVQFQAEKAIIFLYH